MESKAVFFLVAQFMIENPKLVDALLGGSSHLARS